MCLKMVAFGTDAPEPPEGPQDLSPGTTPVPNIHQNDDSDDDIDYYEGYEPLPLAPVEEHDGEAWNSALISSDSSEDEQDPEVAEPALPASNDVPFIETVQREVTRELWTLPRDEANIEMNAERAREVMSAMANFSLPASSFPEWAHSISEEEWRQQLAKRINISQDNR